MIKRMKFIIISVILCAVLLSVMLFFLFSRADLSHKANYLGGGVTHYVDTKAPKTINSTQIISFHCEFSTTNLAINSSPAAGRYHTLRAAQDNCSYEARVSSTIYNEKTFTPDAAFFDALQQIVSQYDFAQYNGQFYTVSGLPPNLGAKLEIQYDSGECIHSSNNQSCFIPLEAMEELVTLFNPDDSSTKEQE